MLLFLLSPLKCCRCNGDGRGKILAFARFRIASDKIDVKLPNHSEMWLFDCDTWKLQSVPFPPLRHFMNNPNVEVRSTSSKKCAPPQTVNRRLGVWTVYELWMATFIQGNNKIIYIHVLGLAISSEKNRIEWPLLWYRSVPLLCYFGVLFCVKYVLSTNVDCWTR